jgi:hypothetical protein
LARKIPTTKLGTTSRSSRGESLIAAYLMVLALSCAACPLPVLADGAMVLQGRVLSREGRQAPEYCRTHDAECDAVKTKYLSGYGYLRGRILGGVVAAGPTAFDRLDGLASMGLSVVSAALPAGDMTLGNLDAVIGTPALRRLRVALFEGEGLFFCRDAQSGDRVAPLIGAFTRHCSSDAIVAIDAALLDLRWDMTRHSLKLEWLRAGPSFELLGNGLGYAHLLRSLMIGVPFDLRSVHGGDTQPGASLGAGLRLALLYRTPSWESRLAVRYRTALLGGAGALRENTVQTELRLLHNFFLTDAVVVQIGIALRAVYAQQAADSFAWWAPGAQRWATLAGLYLGWLNESPDI